MKYMPTRQKTPSILLSLICVISLAIAGLIVLSQPGLVKASPTLTYAPVADSFVNQSDSNKNYGNNHSLRIDGNPLERSYLRFEVNGINGNPVTRVTLRIFANSASTSGFSVHSVADNAWQENEIIFDNAPDVGDIIGASGGFSSKSWVEIDVSPLLNSDGTVSLALIGIDQTAINLASSEDHNHVPQLVAEVASPDSPVITNIVQPSATMTRTLLPIITATNTAMPVITPTAEPNPGVPPGGYQPGFPVRAAFYYPWFPEGWNQQGFNPFTSYTPSLGFYDSSSVSVIQAHISAMTYGHVNAAILSWWGQGSATDQRVATILGATPASSNPDFRWTLYYENESQGNPTVTQIQNDLLYIGNHYGSNSSFLKVNGKFVLFVYADAADSCGMADRWVQADNALGHPAYIVLKVFSGYRTCGSQPDSWHQYSPAVAADEQKGYSFAISPGFWKKGEASARLVRNLATWNSNVNSMVTSGDPWQLITTFNEWGEGTSIESAVEWTSTSGYGQYLDVLHNNGGNPAPPPTAQPTNTPIVSPTPIPSGTPPPSNDPILFYTSDLVSGSSVDRGQAVVSLIQNLMSQHPGTQMLVASGGDNEQENSPTLSNYQSYFGSTYATFVNQGIFMQVRGNHDIQSAGSYTDFDGTVHSTGAAYWDYFGSNAHMANIAGKKLTDYSYDLGSWHIIALDQLNGSVNTATLNFLTSDLAAHASTTCQMVYWHVPTYSSGAAHGDATGLIPLNQAEFNAGVEIQLNGHDHDYQRFYPINPSGVRDDAHGITTFVAGIGGQNSRSGSQTSIAQAASAIYLDAFPGGASHAIGAIQFTLHATSAEYKLYDANDGSVLDSGTVTCH